MRNWGWPVVVGCAVTGLAVGPLEAAKWLRVLTPIGSPQSSTFLSISDSVLPYAALLVLGLGLLAYGLTLRLALESPARGVMALTTGAMVTVLVYVGLQRLGVPLLALPVTHAGAIGFGAGLSLGLVAYVACAPPKRDRATGLLRTMSAAVACSAIGVLARLALGDDGVPGFGGYEVYRAATLSPELRTYPALVRNLAGGLLLGSIAAGTASIFLAKRSALPRRMIAGGLCGALASAVLFAQHCLVMCLVMQSGMDPEIAYRWTLNLAPAAWLLIGVTLAAVLAPTPMKLARTAVCVMCAGAVVSAMIYAGQGERGAANFRAAVNADMYRSRVYIHFHPDGSWTRTIEYHADDIRIARCDRLISDYPLSIYAADARYTRALSLFRSWRFAEAAQELQVLQEIHPGARPMATQLLGLCYLAQGSFSVIAGDFGRDQWDYSEWRSGDGAQMVGHAYQVMGKPNAARGLYTYYIENLSRGSGGAWLAPALQYAENSLDTLPSSSIPTRMGVVRGRITGPAGALSAIHIALVQPHIDGFAPVQSRQFTGALTLPLWFGLGATTDRQGNWEIRHVPYGQYEVVVGFDSASLPSKLVISEAIAPIQVKRPDVEVPVVRFVRSLRPLAPIDSNLTTLTPTLTWEPYPSAAYYTVTVMAMPEWATAKASESANYTCWTQSHIRSTRVTMSSQFFVVAPRQTPEGRLGHLAPGGTYMWIVFAHDASGRIISSSEHYRLDKEPVFVTGSQRLEGG